MAKWIAFVVLIMLFVTVGVTQSAATQSSTEIRWSWQETISPLNLVSFAQTLQYDKWQEIDERTTRRLFEDVIQRALTQMEIKGNGGDFEKVLRQKLLYFVPEREYYWPPYEEDFSKREVKFPIEVMRRKDTIGGETLLFHLGRFTDEDREVYINIDKLDKIGEFLPRIFIEATKQKYLPGVSGPPKVEHLLLSEYSDKVELERYYGNKVYAADRHDYVEEGIFRDDGVIQRYQKGNSTAVVNNIQSEPELDLSGIDMLFDLPKSSPLNEDWEVWDRAFYQSCRGIINLCRLQLNLADNGYEVEQVLWRDFFTFAYDTEHFGMGSEDCSVTRIATGKEDREEFLFDVGNVHTARHIYLTLSKEFAPPGYEWGVEQISLSRAIMVQGAVGEEERVFEFGFGVGNTPFADYFLTQSDNDGYTVLDKPAAFFRYDNPRNMITAQVQPELLSSTKLSLEAGTTSARTTLDKLRIQIEELPHDDDVRLGEVEALSWLLASFDGLWLERDEDDNYYKALELARACAEGLDSGQSLAAWLDRINQVLEWGENETASPEINNILGLVANTFSSLLGTIKK